jgi:hypothetical protein
MEVAEKLMPGTTLFHKPWGDTKARDQRRAGDRRRAASVLVAAESDMYGVWFR